MARDPAALGHIRDQVGSALRGFLAQQRTALLRVGTELLPGLDAVEELLAAGKRLRPAFC
jgi:geranylgeranyl diphosphate synthase, type I